jgi:hypothetical protein
MTDIGNLLSLQATDTAPLRTGVSPAHENFPLPAECRLPEG